MMIRQFLKKILSKPIGTLADKYDSRPDAKRVFAALTELNQNMLNNPGKKGPVIDITDKDKFIIFSDQHKAPRTAQIFLLWRKGIMWQL